MGTQSKERYTEGKTKLDDANKEGEHIVSYTKQITGQNILKKQQLNYNNTGTVVFYSVRAKWVI
jgi:hypothetical protein